MKYIITGGAGFIGSHLVERLIKYKSNKIIVIVNLSTGRIENISNFKNIKFVKCDLSKKNNSWIKYFKNIDCVFHLAALADIVPSIEKPEKYFQSNVTATLNIIQACRKYKVKKLLYSASSSCYGITKHVPTNESHEISTQYPYALTKYLGEQICLHWGKVYKIKVISLRLFNVYGTRSRTSGTYGAMFGTFLTQKLNKKPYTIVGDGSQSRDFTYVTDVVEAFLKASKSNISNEVFNVGSGKHVSVKKIAKYLGGETIHIPKRPGEPDITFADTTKIKRKLNWKPKIDIKMGIKELIKNIDYWKNAPLWTPIKIKRQLELGLNIYHNEKIYNLHELSKIIENRKNNGNRIVMCHGVFDLIHLGHIEHFKQKRMVIYW